MTENSTWEETIDKSLDSISTEYYSILDLAREYDAPILAVVDRQDIRHLENKLKGLIFEIECLSISDHRNEMLVEASAIMDSLSGILSHENI